MNYTPKTEEQLAEEALLADGTYDFEVIGTSDKPSKKGNDMFTLNLCIFSHDGTQRFINDYIAMGNNFGERKLRRAAVACGLLDIYTSGSLQAYDFRNMSGKVLLKQQNGTDDYPLPKNVVGDYLPRDDNAPAIHRIKPEDIIDDGIPF